MAMQGPEKIKRVRILANRAHPDKKLSAVQTSAGDKFEGEIVEVPETEARMLIALGRGEEAKAKAAA
jgi:hypothetical protein